MRELRTLKLGLKVLAVGGLFAFAACTPQTAPTNEDVSASGQNNAAPATETLAGFEGETRNFFVQSGLRVFDVMTWSDPTVNSFMLWGDTVQTQVKALPTTTKVCLLFEYRHVTPSRVLALSAVRRRQVVSQTATSVQAAYQWLFYPHEAARNQQDCLTAGLITAKNQLFGSSSTLTFSVTDTCPGCSISPVSQGARLHFNSGNVLSGVDVSALKLRIGAGTTAAPDLSCTTNGACQAQGYSCCLTNQCVKDGAVKNGVNQSQPAFLQALSEVAASASAFRNYPQYFYVCPTNTPAPVPDEGDDAAAGEFAALQLSNELRDLHLCLNPQFDEISYCSLRFSNASQTAGRIFSAGRDDNNFRWANASLGVNTVRSIRYGEVLLYQEGLTGYDTTPVASSHGLQGTANGDLGAGVQQAYVPKVLPTGHPDDTLVLQYKVDGTCEKVSTGLVRCRKSYVQGQVTIPPRPTDHASGMDFALPSYASTADPYLPSVSLGGSPVASGDTTWEMVGQNVHFNFTVNTNQRVDITYYVTTDTDHLMHAKTVAQARVNTICGCSNADMLCNLTPKTDASGAVTTYDCRYPSATPVATVPIQQQVYLSSKTVPSRYYDTNGVAWDNDTSANAPAQEGTEFRYTGNSPLAPNNATSYVGFHEIYGSFNKTTGAPKPPRAVTVKKNTTYDIQVLSGTFNPCPNCGTDPYQATLRLFPQTFNSPGGGYVPDVRNSSRRTSTGAYRADDLLFGRACFVPATMLAGTHATGTTVSLQRKRRMAAQHFLYANGHSRDWYGFDYGAVIGSFDGVTWFAVGGKRRITTPGSKLLLAVNAPFGDLTSDSSSVVMVTEVMPTTDINNTVLHDTQSDGAQCQKSHYCSTDDDCIRQVGYDYTCQDVRAISTKWPQFDTAGNEAIGEQTLALTALVKGINGQARRCVYRGRGAACDRSLAAYYDVSAGTDSRGFMACSPNHHCAAVEDSRFNQGIARWASPASSQNVLITPVETRDVFGLGARHLGRPADYYATRAPSTINSTAWGLAGTNLRDHLKNTLGIKALCQPGRDVVNSITYADAQSRAPGSTQREPADRIFGVGPTIQTSTSLTSHTNLLAMCPATENGTYIHHDHTRALSNAAVAVAQNIPSSLLDVTEFANLGIFNTTVTSGNKSTPALTAGHQRYSCMRAPGAACFSDLECAPSELVAGKMKSLGSWGNFAGNVAEQAFWKEELVCGNPEPVYDFTGVLNASYDIKSNKCCRETSKTMQVYTQFDASTAFLNCAGLQPAIAGVNLAINSAARNTRNHVGYDKVTCADPAAPVTQSYPALLAPSPRTAVQSLMRVEHIINQYKTLDLVNSRMCCTGNWVRNFASENGGGHQWGEGRSQSIDKKIFFAWNWYADEKFTTTLDEDDTQPLHCSNENVASLACEMRSLTDAQASAYLNWIERFELVGIPQVLIPDPRTAGVEKLVDSSQASLEGQGQALDDTLATPLTYGALNRPNIADVVDGSNSKYYVSAANYTKMAVSSGKLKKVFSESEFSCCVPAGNTVPQSASAGTCCTGTLTDFGGGPARCCLGDFSDVTVYLNRYVSSEGRGLSEGQYDQETGYIKNPADVAAIARSRNLCCSGKIVRGNAIFSLPIPLLNGAYNAAAKTRRFVYRSDAVDNNEAGALGDYYESGIRWNNHYYCAPADYEEP